MDKKAPVYKVVIVNYGKGKAVKELLRQLSGQSLPPGSVAVVDNSPVCELQQSDCVGMRFDVSILAHPENLGYSKACNIGCGGEWEYVVFLNPDIEIRDSGFSEKLFLQIGALANVGCVGVAQRNPDGSYERVARKFPSIPAIIGKRVPALRRLFSNSVNAYLGAYPCDYGPGSQPVSVDWLQSSFLVVPRLVWEKLGGFDERFFVFMADTEYGLRCRRHGLNSYLVRSLQVHADGVRSSAGGIMDIFRKKTIRIHLRDALRYYLGV